MQNSEDPHDEPVVARQSESIEDKVDKLYEDIGGCGCFQVFAYFALAFGMSSPSWFVYEIGFLTQEPDKYICTYTTPIPAGLDICNKDNICAGNPWIATYEADPNDDKTLYNWY